MRERDGKKIKTSFSGAAISSSFFSILLLLPFYPRLSSLSASGGRARFITQHTKDMEKEREKKRRERNVREQKEKKNKKKRRWRPESRTRKTFFSLSLSACVCVLLCSSFFIIFLGGHQPLLVVSSSYFRIDEENTLSSGFDLGVIIKVQFLFYPLKPTFI